MVNVSDLVVFNAPALAVESNILCKAHYFGPIGAKAGIPTGPGGYCAGAYSNSEFDHSELYSRLSNELMPGLSSTSPNAHTWCVDFFTFSTYPTDWKFQLHTITPGKTFLRI